MCDWSTMSILQSPKPPLAAKVKLMMVTTMVPHLTFHNKYAEEGVQASDFPVKEVSSGVGQAPCCGRARHVGLGTTERR
eukprot:1801764-Amphidinium_carterae.1